MKLTDEMVFKWLGENGEAHHGGAGQWGLPKHGAPGDWMPHVSGVLIPCKNGYHLCRKQDLVLWCAPRLFVAEYKFKAVEHRDKLVVRRARLLYEVTTWNERTARRFACDCAERVLHIYEKQYPTNLACRKVIEVARLYSNGSATKDEMDAAWRAARDASWSAAGDAPRIAAISATRTAACNASLGASWDAARKAARASVWNASWDTAWKDSWNDSWENAWAEARATAWNAEQKLQTEQLWKYLTGEIQ